MAYDTPDPTREQLLTAFGRAITKARREQNLTQAALARRAGLRREHVGRAERGQTNPTLTVIARLARGLGSSFATLGAATDTELARTMSAAGPATETSKCST